MAEGITGITQSFPDAKYKVLLAQERSLAKAVALEVIGQNQVTVWDVLIPFVFLYNFLRFGRAREAFALNFLFTKKLALEAAVDMAKKGQSRQEVTAAIEAKTGNVLASDKKGIYTDKIRQRQMKEIGLLIDHYRRLFDAEGNTYPSLVRSAYQAPGSYTAFLHQLKEAERDVNQAALQAVGRTASALKVVSAMEKASQRMRMAEAEEIFHGKSPKAVSYST